MANRVSQVRQRVEEYDVDAVLLSALPSIRWATGFTGTNGLLFVTADVSLFVTDGRYREQARQEVDGADVIVATNGLMTAIVEEGYLDAVERVAFQADDVTVQKYRQLQKNCADTEWVPKTMILTRQVGRKEEQEVRQIRRAQSVTEDVFDHVLDTVKPGDSEQEVAAEITYHHLRKGAEKMAFDPIVASGRNGAYPHARPTDRTLREGDVVVIDMGCIFDGYASDMTRMVAIGEPSPDVRNAYEIVRRAQERALNHAHAGMTGKEVDALARDVIEEGGLGDYFSHGLGHGIGLQVHEWPRVSYSVEEELPEGVCVTIEPGVYIPEKGFGIRIEDIVVLQNEGCRNLTSTSKALPII